MTRTKIGTLDDFPESEGVGLSVNGLEIAVFNVDGELYAILNRCLHKQYTLHEAGKDLFNDDGKGRTRGRIDTDSCSITCPWHGLEWNLRDGYNPVMDKSIPTFEIDVEGEDVFLLR